MDDDKAMLDQLHQLISAELTAFGETAYCIDTYQSGEDFLAEWSAGKYDLIVLDIYMNRLNGVDVAETIRETDPDVRLAFCTSSNEFASESYAVSARDYLQKPVTAQKISRLFQKIGVAQMEQARSVCLPDGYPIRLRQIIYMEYSNHRCMFHIKSGQPHSLYASFSEITALLAPHGYFYSPTKGVLLNFYEVAQITADTFVMKNGKVLPVARRNCKDAKARYSAFQFRTLSQEVDF